MKGVKERFDAFLIKEGVYEEWYQRMRKNIPADEQETFFEDEPEDWGPEDWIYGGFVWGEGFQDLKEGMKDVQRWSRINEKWVKEYARISN